MKSLTGTNQIKIKNKLGQMRNLANIKVTCCIHVPLSVTLSNSYTQSYTQDPTADNATNRFLARHQSLGAPESYKHPEPAIH